MIHEYGWHVTETTENLKAKDESKFFNDIFKK